MKIHIAQAWESAYSKVATLPDSHRGMLNQYFAGCMGALLECFFSVDTLSSGTILAFSNSIGMILEDCDYANL